MSRFDAELASSASAVSPIGNFLGWNVLRAPFIASSSSGMPVLARVQLTKRVTCQLDTLLGVSFTKQKDLSPVVVAPIRWSIHHRHNVGTRMLQDFGNDNFVFVHSIPGEDRHLRYLYLVQRSQWLFMDGRRWVTIKMAVVDSEANRLNREADAFQEDVDWVTEGGLHVSMTEVDDRSVDIVVDRWAPCHNKVHADYVMAQWAQYSNWWEQTVAPAQLLL